MAEWDNGLHSWVFRWPDPMDWCMPQIDTRVKGFTDLNELFEWVTQKRYCSHLLRIPFEAEISLELSPDLRRILLRSYDRKGIAPMEAKGHYRVLENPVINKYPGSSRVLEVKVDDKDRQLIPGGFAKLDLSYELPFLNVELSPRGFEVDEVKEIFYRADRRTIEVVEGILEGKFYVKN